MKKYFISLFLAMLCVSPCAADFTSPEKVEIAKLVQAGGDTASTIRLMGEIVNFVKDQTPRPKFYAVLRQAIQTAAHCRDALGYLFNDGEAPNLTRSQTVQLAFQSVGYCAADERALGNLMVATGQALGPAAYANMIGQGTVSLQTAATLDKFNKTLTYEGWKPASYPNVLGPHGDFDLSNRSTSRTDLFLLHTLKDASDLYGLAAVWTPGANVGLREIMVYGGIAHSALIGIWALNSGVVLGGNEGVIALDAAAASGIRPPSFFALLREVELSFASGHVPPTFSGRILVPGVSGDLHNVVEGMGGILANAMSVNSPSEVQRWFYLSNYTGIYTQVTAQGRAAEWFVHLSAAWRELDLMGLSWLLFFHEIPAPPAVGVFCGPGTIQNANNVCVIAP